MNITELDVFIFQWALPFRSNNNNNNTLAHIHSTQQSTNNDFFLYFMEMKMCDNDEK